jgi:UDP-N-acetylglucosamine 4,6-dehydratase (inverting)
MENLNNKKVLITGGTGSFGKAFVNLTLKKYNPKKIVIYSRDESKQWDMQQDYKNSKKIEFIIGDIRDYTNLNNSMREMDLVVHAAATKIVPTAETNPFECIKTNINGSMNVINAAINNNVKKVVALSTDKACNPINLYGATKLAADKLFISGNLENKKKNTKFSIVRYGNVIGSRGSVIPFFQSVIKKYSKIPITDLKMTRFIINLKECVQFVWMAFDKMHGGEIFVKKIPSMKILDIANAITKKKNSYDVIGIRPGEKLHEEMISLEDSFFTYEFKDFYKILPSILDEKSLSIMSQGGKKVSKDFSYKSNVNDNWISSKELKNWLKKNPTFF